MLRSITFFKVSILCLTLTACGNTLESPFERVASASQVDQNTPPEGEVNPGTEDVVLSDETPLEGSEEQQPEEWAYQTVYDKAVANSNLEELAIQQAFTYYEENLDEIDNKKWVTIFDIGQHSGRPRLNLINMETGDVVTMHVAHGKNSDTNNDGYATSFSNVNGSLQSSLGFMLTGFSFSGGKGYSMLLHGLEDRNSNVRSREIIVHSATYVNPSYSQMGRSWGCPAVSTANNAWLIDRIKNGSLMYIYYKGQ